MYKFETNEEIIAIIEKSKDSEKAAQVLAYVADRLQKENIIIQDYKWQSLVNHIAEMVTRSVSGEKLDDMDESIFGDIGAESIGFAKDVVDKIGNLPESEKFLLSVHFEAAKTNL